MKLFSSTSIDLSSSRKSSFSSKIPVSTYRIKRLSSAVQNSNILNGSQSQTISNFNLHFHQEPNHTDIEKTILSTHSPHILQKKTLGPQHDIRQSNELKPTTPQIPTKPKPPLYVDTQVFHELLESEKNGLEPGSVRELLRKTSLQPFQNSKVQHRIEQQNSNYVKMARNSSINRNSSLDISNNQAAYQYRNSPYIKGSPNHKNPIKPVSIEPVIADMNDYTFEPQPRSSVSLAIPVSPTKKMSSEIYKLPSSVSKPSPSIGKGLIKTQKGKKGKEEVPTGYAVGLGSTSIGHLSKLLQEEIVGLDSKILSRLDELGLFEKEMTDTKKSDSKPSVTSISSEIRPSVGSRSAKSSIHSINQKNRAGSASSVVSNSSLKSIIKTKSPSISSLKSQETLESTSVRKSPSLSSINSSARSPIRKESEVKKSTEPLASKNQRLSKSVTKTDKKKSIVSSIKDQFGVDKLNKSPKQSVIPEIESSNNIITASKKNSEAKPKRESQNHVTIIEDHNQKDDDSNSSTIESEVMPIPIAPIKKTSLKETLKKASIALNKPSSPLNIPETIQEQNMQVCKHCSRSFSTEDNRHLRHEAICVSNMKKAASREKKRLSEEKKKEKEKERDRKIHPEPIIPKADWRKAHEQFIEAIRAAKSYK